MTFPVIPELPPAPNPAEPGTFNTRAAAFVAALPEFRTAVNNAGAYLSTLAVATGPGLFTSGSATAPGIAFADNTNLGFFRPEANVIDVSTGGTARARVSSAGLRLGGLLTDTTGIDSTLTVQTGGTAAAMAVARYVAGAANGPMLTLARSKSGTLGAYTAVTSGDWLGEIRFNGGDGTNLATQGSGIRSTATATATTGNVRANLQLMTRGSDGLQVRLHVADSTNVGIGTTSPTATLHVAGTLRVQTYTVATLPSAAAVGNGGRAHVTDASATTFQSIVAGGGANNVPVYSDGTNWRIG